MTLCETFYIVLRKKKCFEGEASVYETCHVLSNQLSAGVSTRDYGSPVVFPA